MYGVLPAGTEYFRNPFVRHPVPEHVCHGAYKNVISHFELPRHIHPVSMQCDGEIKGINKYFTCLIQHRLVQYIQVIPAISRRHRGIIPLCHDVQPHVP